MKVPTTFPTHFLKDGSLFYANRIYYHLISPIIHVTPLNQDRGENVARLQLKTPAESDYDCLSLFITLGIPSLSLAVRVGGRDFRVLGIPCLRHVASVIRDGGMSVHSSATNISQSRIYHSLAWE